MRNKDKWAPTKYVYRKGKLMASRDQNEVRSRTRLLVDLTASLYDAYLSKYARGRLLDLGCGKVPLYEAYREYVTDTICVDWGNSLNTSEYIDKECDLTEPLPFEDGEFDTLILSDVLEHIPQPELLWQEMSRILKPGGNLFLNVPFFFWLHETPYDYYRYTEFALRRFAERTGFRLVVLKSLGGTPEILTDLIAKHVYIIPLFGKWLATSMQVMTALFLRTSFGRRCSERTSKQFPLGYFLVAEKQ
ncbi:MAG: class I SAM-dependent methyltransferase [Nitrospirae bacterium]|nr:class I SAM-dependent methyltransferase [Nitrospirota bacterium]